MSTASTEAAISASEQAPGVGAPRPGWLERLRKALFARKPRMRRVSIALCTWQEAQGYLDRGFTIAPEEDTNSVPGLVWLEKLEPVP